MSLTLKIFTIKFYTIACCIKIILYIGVWKYMNSKQTEFAGIKWDPWDNDFGIVSVSQNSKDTEHTNGGPHCRGHQSTINGLM